MDPFKFLAIGCCAVAALVLLQTTQQPRIDKSLMTGTGMFAVYATCSNKKNLRYRISGRTINEACRCMTDEAGPHLGTHQHAKYAQFVRSLGPTLTLDTQDAALMSQTKFAAIYAKAYDACVGDAYVTAQQAAN